MANTRDLLPHEHALRNKNPFSTQERERAVREKQYVAPGVPKSRDTHDAHTALVESCRAVVNNPSAERSYGADFVARHQELLDRLTRE